MLGATQLDFNLSVLIDAEGRRNVPRHLAFRTAGCARIHFSMRHLDLTVIVLYLIAITWFGARFRTSQKTLKD